MGMANARFVMPIFYYPLVKRGVKKKPALKPGE
jgi:hypothetical protein